MAATKNIESLPMWQRVAELQRREMLKALEIESTTEPEPEPIAQPDEDQEG